MDKTPEKDSCEVNLTEVCSNNETVKFTTSSCPPIQTQNDCTKPKRLPRSMKKKLLRENKMAAKRSLRKEKKMCKKQKLQENESESLKNPTDIECLKNLTKGENSNNHPENETLKSLTERENSENPTENVIENKTMVDLCDHVPKRVRKEEIQQRCKDAMESGQKICIDFGLESHMTPKECSKLAQQVGRLYGSNRKSSKPAHIYLTSVNKEGTIYKECLRKNSGFENYVMDMSEKSPEELFKPEDIVYLSPDSKNILREVNPNKVYIIGGLIDESVKNDITLTKAVRINVQTAKLPIDEYMVKCSDGQHSYKKILTVNQVFDILLTVNETSNWKVALEMYIPKRTGLIVKSDS